MAPFIIIKGATKILLLSSFNGWKSKPTEVDNQGLHVHKIFLQGNIMVNQFLIL